MTTRARVLYVIEDQHPRRDRWIKRGDTGSTLVDSTGYEAATEIAERLELTRSWIAEQGYRIRLRVWPEPADWLAFNPDDEPADGTWIYDPQDKS